VEKERHWYQKVKRYSWYVVLLANGRAKKFKLEAARENDSHGRHKRRSDRCLKCLRTPVGKRKELSQEVVASSLPPSNITHKDDDTATATF
jgi:hypothetical protein